MAAAPLPYLPDVYRAICQVQKGISRDGISKDGRNQQQGYSFRGIDDIYNSLSGLLAAADLCILPRMISRAQEERATAKGGVLFYVTVQAEFDFVSSRDASMHTVTIYGEAMDSADKATNKAMSAAYKYACLQVFCIPTEGMANDADAITHHPAPKQTPAQPAPKHTPAQQRVIESRLAEVKKAPQAAVAIAEEIPEPEDEDRWTNAEDEPTGLERDLHESIIMAERMKTPQPERAGGRALMMQAFESIKERYRKIGWLKTYYAQLGRYGMQNSDEFPDTDDGISQARCCYKEMSLDVANREVRGR
jgi:hypothetical protein